MEQAIAARGGAEALHAITSLRLSGKASFGPVAGVLHVEFKRPNRMRMELVLPQGTLLRLFDGTTGWTSKVASATPALEPMSATEVARARREADMDGPLLDASAKGIHFALAGRGEVQGRPTEALDVFFPDGTVLRYQLDAATHEPLGWAETRRADGKHPLEETRFRSNRRVQGVLFPVAVETGVHGGPTTSHLSIDTIELNPPLDDARFRPPLTDAGPAR
ncbi:MAG: hypothetical protein ACLPJH_10870 [Myxococcaceae bacterium]